jgi:2-iminobutanoate/2-iminopropanoate deaminase
VLRVVFFILDSTPNQQKQTAMKKIIQTDKAPKAIGPYSQAVEVNNTLYISGQLPMDPETMEMPATIGEQAEQVMRNIGAILKEAGYDYKDVVKSTIFLDDIKDFQKMNGVYGQYYQEEPPARSAYEVANLPKGAKIEIETIAVK